MSKNPGVNSTKTGDCVSASDFGFKLTIIIVQYQTIVVKK